MTNTQPPLAPIFNSNRFFVIVILLAIIVFESLLIYFQHQDLSAALDRQTLQQTIDHLKTENIRLQGDYDEVVEWNDELVKENRILKGGTFNRRSFDGKEHPPKTF
jgi:cell division protein FtsL